MMEEERTLAVCVENACKSYGKKEILNKLNMHVEKGTIYGLLGASGCGKTTLLRCIVGMAKLDSGEICVLGGHPGTPESRIPGSALGYMPQEIALIDELTVQGAIYYFARIYGLSEDVIHEKYASLAKLLDLPPSDRYIQDCSGGQQRRVSLAAALVGDPELLILDEPTVGLDPVIREKIWNYFLELAEKQEIAVIITTHYIEETRQAHKIGLMRQGVLLTEDAPESLLNKFGTNSLEEVFLILSQNQAEGRLCGRNDAEIQPISSSSTSTIGNESNISQKALKSNSKVRKRPTRCLNVSLGKVKALVVKNWNQIVKNPSGFSFMMLYPLLQTFLFFLTVGIDVRDINVALVNHEDNFGTCTNYSRNQTAIPHDENECTFRRLGCRYAELLQDPMINLVNLNDTSEAIEGITHGKFIGAISIPKNFSLSIEERVINSPLGTSEKSLNDSQIKVWLDISERNVGTAVRYKLIKKMIDLLKSTFTDCNYLVKYGELPLRFEEAVYGHNDDLLRVFVIPGVMLTMMFFLGAINTTPTVIADRLGGMWERSVIAGVSSLEIILTHFITQLLLIIVQGMIVIAITFAVYQTEYLGSFPVVVVLVILQGVCGMAYGFLISVCAPNLSAAHFATSGSFHPMIVLCGIIWPIEGMPLFLKYFSQCLPFTVPISSLRNVITKGWSILHVEVVDGIAIEIAWIIVLLSISVLFLKRKD